MEENKFDSIEFFRVLFVKADIFLHVIAAMLLLVACSFIFYFAILNVLSPSRVAIIHLVNDVLLALIILELLWTVIRFLKKQKFVLAPFFGIGIIAAIRRILLIEAQASYMEHVPVEKLYEMGLSGLIVVALMIAYYLSVKSQKLEQ
jgi:uncharacterized membrane protein (DUF373 family)